jgi:GNAT superfamily N-acetyltransferase
MTNSPQGTLTIRPASPEELSVVMDIYDDAARWLHAQGIYYWAYPQPWWIRDLVASDIEKGCVFLCRAQAEGRAVGTLRILWADPAMWPEDAGNAGYIHGLAVRTDARGHGVGAAMLEWAKAPPGARGFSCGWIARPQPILRRYYERLGTAFRAKRGSRRRSLRNSRMIKKALSSRLSPAALRNAPPSSWPSRSSGRWARCTWPPSPPTCCAISAARR